VSAPSSSADLNTLLRRSALEWRLTFDALASPLLLLEPDGHVVRLNEAARELAGVSFEAAVHHPLSVLGEGEPWRSVRGLLSQAAGSAGGSGRVATRARDGMGRTWEVSVNPANRPEGGQWLVVVLMDVSDLVRLQESLRRSETLSAMGALVAGVAHEVRNPLFGISATLDAFEKRCRRKPAYQRYFEVLRERVGRLSELMQNLLDYGKPALFELSEERPAELAAAAVDACGPLARAREVAIRRVAEPGLPRVRVDRGQAVQVLQNLLENAIQHSPPGSEVFLRAGRDGGAAVLFTVEDRGPGFRREDLERLFEPFYTRRPGGTGLGLSIVQRIVEEHGGKVAAENRPGGGAVMRVALPV
jgi:PAS domain S-box-containing protein